MGQNMAELWAKKLYTNKHTRMPNSIVLANKFNVGQVSIFLNETFVIETLEMNI